MKRAILARLASERGFTLSEMLVVIAILGIILAAASLIFSSTIRHSGEIQEQNLLQTEVRAATDRIARDVRQAYVGDGSSPIEVSTGTQLQFLSLDNQQPYHLRRIAYRLNGSSLERAMAVSTNTNGPPWTFPALSAWGQVVGSVQNTAATFTYYDGTRPTPQPTTTPAEVRSVTIALNLVTKTNPNRTITYSTSAALRASP